MVALRPDDHRHRRGGPGIREVVRLRGRKRHFSFRQRRPIQAGLWPSGRGPTNDVRLSCSRTGDCHDNAVAESFFAAPKNKMYYRRRFPTRDAAKHAVIEFIETDHSRKRPHSTIGYKVTAQAMESFFERTKPESEPLPMAA